MAACTSARGVIFQKGIFYLLGKKDDRVNQMPDFTFLVATRAASVLRSCFLSTPSISSGSLFGVQPKQGTPNSEIFFARRSSKLGTPLSDKARRHITRTPDSTMSFKRLTNWPWLPPS